MAYLSRMGYWQHVSPRGAIADLVHEWRRPNPYRWQILGLSVALTFTLMVLVIPETQRAEPKRPSVTYIATFDPNRTEAEIIASNLENQKRKETREAELAALQERKREAFRALGRASGFDVDALEAQFKDDEPTRQAAPAAAPQGKAEQPKAAVDQSGR